MPTARNCEVPSGNTHAIGRLTSFREISRRTEITCCSDRLLESTRLETTSIRLNTSSHHSSTFFNTHTREQPAMNWLSEKCHLQAQAQPKPCRHHLGADKPPTKQTFQAAKAATKQTWQEEKREQAQEKKDAFRAS